MRFLSLEKLAAQTRAAATRFPFVLLSAGIAAGAALALVNKAEDDFWVRVLFCALLGLPIHTALTTTGERAKWDPRTRLAIHIVASLALVALWFPFERWTEAMRVTRFAHLAILVHLVVAVLPFAGTSLSRAFWQYNRLLFLRFLTAALFAAVLFAGLAIALVAINQLFDVKVDEKWYVRLWIVIALIFHPWFFLGGIPSDLTALESREDYPAVLKVFSQFILIPVVSVYMLILTAYLVRVVVTRTWPSGWIGYLVSSVATTGILALLLVHPVRERSDSRWVDAYGRWFFLALLPSIGMLLMAIWLRVNQYGWTERRYFLAVLAVWLAAIAIYYGLTGSRNIRIIPASLALIAIVTFAGPWSAYAVSLRDQLGRLRDIMTAQGLLTASGVGRAAREISFEDRRELSAILRYLIDTHGAAALGTFSEALVGAAKNPRVRVAEETPIDHPAARAVMEEMGLAYVTRWEERGVDRIMYFTANTLRPVRVDDYQWMSRVNLISSFVLPVDGDSIEFKPDSQPARLTLSRRGVRLLEVPLWPLAAEARKAQGSDTLRSFAGPRPVRPPTAPNASTGKAPLIVEAAGAGVRLRLVVTYLGTVGESTAVKVRTAEAVVLLRLDRK